MKENGTLSPAERFQRVEQNIDALWKAVDRLNTHGCPFREEDRRMIAGLQDRVKSLEQTAVKRSDLIIAVAIIVASVLLTRLF